jgi:hypothetical protein
MTLRAGSDFVLNELAGVQPGEGLSQKETVALGGGGAAGGGFTLVTTDCPAHPALSRSAQTIAVRRTTGAVERVCERGPAVFRNCVSMACLLRRGT